jgi:hypothetical protein
VSGRRHSRELGVAPGGRRNAIAARGSAAPVQHRQAALDLRRDGRVQHLVTQVPLRELQVGASVHAKLHQHSAVAGASTGRTLQRVRRVVPLSIG